MNWFYILEIVIYILLTLFFVIEVKSKHFFDKESLSIGSALLFSFLLFLAFPLDFFNMDIAFGVVIITWKIIGFLLKRFHFDGKIVLAISLVLSLTILGYSYYCKNHVMGTFYRVKTKKEIGETFRILQISDSHIGRTFSSSKFSHYVEEMTEEHPDLVVITGDFVDDDTSKKEMEKSVEALRKLNPKYGIYFVYGNHDKGYHNYRDFNEKDLEEALEKNNIVVLEDEVVPISRNVVLIGRKDKRENRMEMEELVSDIDSDMYQIVLDHQPMDYEKEAESKVDLVLSGHTHGGQFYPIGQLSVLLGINDSYYGLEQREKTTFIVNSGMGNWGFQFKTGTKSEYVIIDVTN